MDREAERQSVDREGLGPLRIWSTSCSLVFL